MKMEGKCCDESSPIGMGVGAQLLRPRWFQGQIVSDRDLNDGAEYLLQVIRLQNRMLHGWGVVCGLRVCVAPDETQKDGCQDPLPWVVHIEPGFALSPWGDHIVVASPFRVDLRKYDQSGPTGEPIDPRSDPWCSDVYKRRQGGTICVGVRYWRTTTRPVRVQPLGCGCDDSRCEYTRWLDSFKVCLLDACPQNHQQPPKFEDLFKGDSPGCPACPEDDCVVLAKVDIGDDGTILEIDNCSCRRLVASFANFWWTCKEQGGLIRIEGISPGGTSELEADSKAFVTIAGDFRYVPKDPQVHLLTPDRKEVTAATNIKIYDNSLYFEITVPVGAKPGSRDLFIDDDQGNNLACKRKLFTVVTSSTERRATRRREAPKPQGGGDKHDDH